MTTEPSNHPAPAQPGRGPVAVAEPLRPTDFVGIGWSFPLGTDATGGIAMAGGDRDVAQAIRIILATAPGERPMRPEFGCRINQFVFAPANAATSGAIAREVRDALEQWEPRIDVGEVRVRYDATDVGVLYIDIGYRIRGRNDSRNLVVPFYVIPGEDAAGPSRQEGW